MRVWWLAFLLVVVGLGGFGAPVSAAPAKELPGAAVFHEKGCEQCHGVHGVGTAKGPNLTGVGRRLSPLQIETQIREGGQAMPAFGDVLEAEEVEQLRKYLGTWRARAPRKK